MSKTAHRLAALFALAAVMFTVGSARAEGESYLLTVNAGDSGQVQVTANGVKGSADTSVELSLTNGSPVVVEYLPAVEGDWRYLSGAPAGAKFSSPTIVSFAMPADACEVTAVPFAYSDDNLACMDNTVQVKTVGPRKVYVFTNASAGAMMVALRRQLTFEEGLVVGGGGSGGQDASAGGGGGVVRLSDVHVLPAASALTVEVGAGGVLADWNVPSSQAYGKNSRYADARGETVALGGGANGGAGGSGSSAGSGTAGQGHDGGKLCQTSPWPSGGGGGAEENGADGAIVNGVPTGGKGGDGRWDSITGEAHCYGSGGGAGGGGASGEGGAESGGRGACSSAGVAFSNGVNGLGGGGGGSNRGNGTHSGKVRGGNGTVILAFTVGDTTARHAEFDAFDSYPMIDGAATPTPTVKVAGTTLTRGEDYDLVYERNTEANRLAYVTIVGKNDYADVYARQPFYPKSVKFVSPNGSDTASGDSWAEAWTANKAAAELAGGTFNELWFASGTYGTNTFSCTLTLSREIALRGGFAADEADLARKAGKTVFDGEGYRNFANFVNVTFAAAKVKEQKVSINDITFTRSWGTALKKSNTAVLELNRCTFEHCGLWQMGASGEPVNMAVSIGNNGGQAVRLTDCVFRGNFSWSGNWTGNLISTLNAAVSFEGCDFVTNGVPFTAAYNASYYATYSLISSSGGPMTFRRCRFVGNRQHARGTWSLINAGSKTGADALTVEHCLFVGNEAMNNSDMSGQSYYGGLVYMNQWTAGANFIRNCTFAYNLIDTTFGACVGVGGSSGVTIENCVFHGMVTTPRHGSNPIAVLNNSTGKVTVRYTLLDNLTDARSLGAGETDLSLGVKTGDPLFVTPSIEGLYTNEGTGKLYFNPTDATLAEVLGLDVHLKSAAGYRVNGDDEWHTAEGAVSAAIDMGNPANDFSAEAEPNGGRINAGVYGGTAEASKTAVCHPAIEKVAVTFPTPYTQPQVAVELGGEGTYSATVRILISTNQLDWSEAIVKEFTAVGNGDRVEWLSPKFLEENSKFYLRVELEAAGADPVTGDGGPYDVEGEMPPWAGKGGDPEKIVHVRADATGLGDGTSWADACTNLFEAVGHLSATRHTLWLAGDFELDDRYNNSSIPQQSATDILGGFTGLENAPEERAEGTLSTVDACNRADGFVFAGADSAVMRIERVRFVHAKVHGFACSGSLYATNCVFAHNNATRKTINGRGLYVYPARTVVLSKCTIADNVNPEQTRWQEAGGKGIGVYVYHQNTAPMVIDNCLFVSNGVPHYSGATNEYNVGAVDGAALRVEHASRVTIRNSRFVGNRTFMNGSIFAFLSWNVPLPYEVKNCLFAGNESVGSAATPQATRLFNMNDLFGVNALFENNTFAYNLADTTDQGLGIGYTGGRLVVRNSIFCGDRNRGGDLCEIFGSISEHSTPTSVVSYSIFPTTNFFSVAGQTAADVIGEGVIYGDARLVSTTNEFAKLVIKGNNNRLSLDWDNKAAEIMAINAHLQGLAGYTDETTGEKVAGSGKTSPCVDKGDPTSDYRQEPKPNGRRVNMGCYGNTPWATCSPGGMAVRVR